MVRSGDTDAIIVDTSDGERVFMLKGAEQPYREMVETMSEGAVTVMSGGVILYCNQRFAEMVKASLETIIGSNLLAYFSGKSVAEVSTALQESHTRVPRVRATLLASDATPVPVNMAMRSQSNPASDSIAIVIADLTKWQHAEQTREQAIELMRASEERLNLVLHSNVTEALYFLDPDGNIESWNAAAEQIKGYTADEIVGRNFEIFFTPEDAARGEPARTLAAARDNGHIVAEGVRLRKDGSRFLASTGLDAIYREDGTLRGFVKMTRDITEQRAAEEERAAILEFSAQRSVDCQRSRPDHACQLRSRKNLSLSTQHANRPVGRAFSA